MSCDDKYGTEYLGVLCLIEWLATSQMNGMEDPCCCSLGCASFLLQL